MSKTSGNKGPLDQNTDTTELWRKLGDEAFRRRFVMSAR
jgi:hypothetical protein